MVWFTLGFFNFTYFLFMYLLIVLCLHCCPRAFSSWGEWGLLSSCSAQASYCSGFSFCRAQALGMQASVVVVHVLSCPVACEIFLDQRLNLCLGRRTPIQCTTRKIPTLVFNIKLFKVLFCRHAFIL